MANLSISAPGEQLVTAVLNLLTALVNRKLKLIELGTPEALAELNNIREAEAFPLFLMRSWNKLFNIPPEPPK